VRRWDGMVNYDEFESHPELEGDPGDDERPLRRPMRRKVIRAVVIAGVAALVLPSVISTVGVQARTAEVACGIVVAAVAPGAVAAVTRFELLGAEGPGWYCYASDFNGTETLIRTLGFIPGLGEPPTRPRDSNPT
jgi:hypothetical protein